MKQLDLFIDFDGTYDQHLAVKRTLTPDYLPLNGSLQERDSILDSKNSTIDGRWMLAGQHLESWRRLWAPQSAEHLPTLAQLVSWLSDCEFELAISRSKSMEE